MTEPTPEVLIMTQFLIATLNIRNVPKMPDGWVREDMTAARNLLGNGSGILLLQEIRPSYYKQACREVFSSGWHYAHLDTENPILWKSAFWRKVDSGKILAHRGRARTSSARHITWVLLQHIATKAVLLVVNTHMVSAAFSARWALHKRWRRKAWQRHWELQRRLIRTWQNKGVPIVGGGDHNRRDLPKFVPEMRFVGPLSGIDDLYYIPTGVKMSVTRHWKDRALHTDHDARVALFNLSEPPIARQE